jgi:hypothetical protein
VLWSQSPSRGHLLERDILDYRDNLLALAGSPV